MKTKRPTKEQSGDDSLAEKRSFTSPFFNNTSFGMIPKLSSQFYSADCIHLAKQLLGQVLVRRLQDGIILKTKIVETECYLGGEDQASHSRNGKRTPRNEPMYMAPGTSYVYLTYGMYHCFNISSNGDGAAVLIRSGEALEGLERMKIHRGAKKKDGGEKLKDWELCNGPSKLCIAMDIDKTLNKEYMPESEKLWIEQGNDLPRSESIVVTKRIGIESIGKEWADKPLRFYVRDSKFVSKRDKKAEALQSVSVQ